ncbi:hypothetical protein ACFXJ8_12270 [Nonomuraea sp. NPDC059194]|uniref:hypothetical protein n=1 Tax=Nonomuraea sp. NPDC059194 TaxID=3346764 RepID=UPI0036B00B0B
MNICSPSNRPGCARQQICYEEITSLDLVAEGVVEIETNTGAGGSRIVVEFHTPWASLIFGLAAVRFFRRHPRLLSGQWLPPGFEECCERLGQPCAPARRLAMGFAGS